MILVQDNGFRTSATHGGTIFAGIKAVKEDKWQKGFPFMPGQL